MLLVWLLVLAQTAVYGQKPDPEGDSLHYQKLETLSEKRKSTIFLYHLIFVDTEPGEARPAGKQVAGKLSFSRFHDKPVQHIYIVVHDPFEYHRRDNNINPSNLLMNAGNSLHIRTRKLTIRNLLLFDKGEAFDSLLFVESERLVRAQKYLREVKFDVAENPDDPSTVDVYIRVWDNWSLLPLADVSTSGFRVRLSEENFAGLGHRFSADTRWKIPGWHNRTGFSYFVPNISNTWINAQLRYEFEGSNVLVRSAEVWRTLYSPLTKWAGGIYLGGTPISQRGLVNDTVKTLEARISRQDVWAARSWKLLGGNSVDARTMHLILSGRYERQTFSDRPTGATGANLFEDQTLMLAGLGITSRKFVRDSYIFDYGKTEDIPVGRAVGLTLGYEDRTTGRWYGAARLGWANYTHFGYVSADLEYGTYYSKGTFSQGVVRLGINYFTPLIEAGRWKLRQFIKPEFVTGIDRLPTDVLSFSESMRDFEDYNYKGRHMLAMTLQLQTYAPYNLIGFRFGPFFYTKFGMLGNGISGFRYSKVFSVIGLGVLLKNDYLIVNNFQISLGYYPNLPGNGTNVFKTSAYQTRDFGLIDLEISRPVQVMY